MTDNVIEVLIKVTGKDGQEVVDTITSSLQGLGDQAKESLAPINADLDTMTGAARLEMLKTLATTGADAFAAIAASAREFVDAAAESELVVERLDFKLGKVGSTIGITSDEIQNLGDQLAGVSGFDDEEIISGMSKLLSFGQLNEEQYRRASAAAVDLAAQTGMSVEAAFSAVARSLEAPEQGFGRLWREIGKLDPAQQTAIDSALKLGDTLKAQDVLLKAYEERIGGASVALGDTMWGQTNKVNLATENFKENIGGGMLPALEAIPMPAKVAGSIIGDLGKSFYDSGIQIYFFTKAAGVLLGSGGLAGLFSGATGLAGAFSFLSAVIHGTLLSIAGVVGTALAAITLPVWLLIGAIAAFIIILVAYWDEIKAGFMMIANLIAATLKRIGFELTHFDSQFSNWLAGLWERFTAWIRSLTTSAYQLATIFQGVGKNIVEGIWKGIQDGWEWLKTNISNSMKSLLGGTGVGAGSFGKVIMPDISPIVGKLREIQTMFFDIKKRLSGLGDEVGKEFIHGIVDTFKTGDLGTLETVVRNLPETIAGYLGSDPYKPIIRAFQRRQSTSPFFDFANTIKKEINVAFFEISYNAEQVVNKIRLGFDELSIKVQTFASALLSGNVNWEVMGATAERELNRIKLMFDTTINKIILTINKIIPTINKIILGWQDFSNGVRRALDTATQYINNWFTTIYSKFVTVGKSIVDGIWAGIQSGWDSLISKIKGLIDLLLAKFNLHLEMGSPSELLARVVGVPMAQGISQGFSQGIQQNMGNFAAAAMTIPSATRGAAMSNIMSGRGNTRVDHLSIHYRTSPQERRYFDRRAERISERALERLIE